MAIITLSRQVAARGDEIGLELAKKLNYKFITRKEIEQKLIDLGFPESKLSKYDERKPGFFASLVKDRDEYLNYVQCAVLESVVDGNAVIIGRGAFAILQSVPNVISIRLVAEQKTRLERLQKEFDWTEKQALQRIQESDTNRAGYHSNFFNVDNTDSTLYHAVLNTGYLSDSAAADIIANIVKENITAEKDVQGQKIVAELLKAQKIINKLYFEYKLNIEFMHASIEGQEVTLHGVSDSTAVIEKALSIIREEMPGFTVKSAVSVVHDFKNY